ncbi:MAG: methyltransferase domain-containing protein [Gammaproteobacteria bacterium]|nr:methyltransferase domain-containing protein [Gammaproteobacteria bacterium]
MSETSCPNNNSIIELYTDLANNPEKDFGWDKGIKNAINHRYKDAWLQTIPEQVWKYCAAVGNPFELGTFNEGDSVLDIGCGAGVDLCIASLLVGKTGKVFGVDLTPAMIELANDNAKVSGLSNVRAYEGSFENLPIDDQSINIVISNGAINLATHKEQVFSEIFRVLSVGGALYFSDMIKDENNSASSSCHGGSWTDCVAGTLRSDELMQLMKNTGFSDIERVSLTHYKTSDSTIGATFKAFKN